MVKASSIALVTLILGSEGALAFCPPTVSPAWAAKASWRRQAAFSLLGSAADGPGRTADIPSLTLSYVDSRDVKALQKLLIKNGATNVAEGESKYGQMVSANIEVDALLRATPDIAPLVKPSGQISLEAIRADQTEAVTMAITPFFQDVRVQLAQGDSSVARVTGWRIDPWMVPGFASVDLTKERYETGTGPKYVWEKFFNPTFINPDQAPNE